jgi:membrane-associated protease RseP (regulator of RpoE activity)
LWQLDGGHIVYSLASRFHRRISLVLAAVLLVLGRYAWSGWYLWGGLLLALTLRFRHPPVYDEWEPLDRSRRVWAVVALAIFLLCFTPWPATVA